MFSVVIQILFKCASTVGRYKLMHILLLYSFPLNVKKILKHKMHTHIHTHPLGATELPLPDSWLLNKDAGNVIKSFTFDTQPAL